MRNDHFLLGKVQLPNTMKFSLYIYTCIKYFQIYMCSIGATEHMFVCFLFLNQHTAYVFFLSRIWFLGFFFLPLDGKLKHMISFQHNKLKKDYFEIQMTVSENTLKGTENTQ